MIDSDKADFTIFVHVFYSDVWEEMRWEIEQALHQPFALVISRPPTVAPVPLPNTPFLKFSHQFEAENRGRDILPFMKALHGQILPTPDIGLKLHTKRSPHRSDGADWRRFLCGSLLETDGEGVLLGQKLMAADHRIGLIAPRAHLMALDGRTAINDGAMSDMLAAFYDRDAIVDVEMPRFAAGSMFWFRRSALNLLLSEEVDTLFAAERGQLDGTAAHALERLFATIVEHQGFVSAAMENAGPILNAPPSSLSESELKLLIDRTLVPDNPFSLPLRDFWRQSPRLLKLAHMVYAKMPKGAIRMVRAVIRR
ncbi:hypothetical protein GAO09_19045 [Rhizobiales bacterium RZME27]|uniref:Rhamnan synthesis protein F n=1 Tax=Endobacterium cereale TaxID=2663029 RepID=A0A6A8AEF5_9HYPH|nr:rhamnan synthesis F family protein [Endobacterium cereale]MQY48140.1 hypothetical protein [Endobacterium cereale]